MRFSVCAAPRWAGSLLCGVVCAQAAAAPIALRFALALLLCWAGVAFGQAPYTASGAAAGAAINTAATAATGASAAVRSVTVVIDDNYPPYIFRDADGRLQGLLKDSWALWQARTGVRVDLQALDWAEAQRRLLAGQADVIDTMFETEARRLQYDFSAPYARLEVPIFFHHSISGIVDASSLKGFTVGVKAGDACIDVLRQHGVDSHKPYASYSALINAAAAGDLRVFCVDKPPAMYLLNQRGIEQDFRQSLPLYAGEFHRAVRKGDLATLALVQQGFERISDEEKAQLHDKWFGKPLASTSGQGYAQYAAQAGYVLLAVALVALTLLAWSLSLHRRVAAKTAELSQSVAALTAAQEASARTLAQLDATLEAIPDLLFEVDDEGRYISYRAARTEMLLVPGEQLLDRRVHELMPPDTASTIMRALAEAQRDGLSTGAQICLPLPNGAHWFELSVARKRRTAGERQHYIVLSRDIQARKAAELALLQSEQSFRHFFDAGLVGMAITLTSKNWGRYNQRLAEMLGYGNNELASKTWAELTHPDDLRPDTEQFNRMLTGELDGYTMDKRYIRKDGSVMHAALAVRCERDAQGQAQRFFAVIEDTSERRQATLALARHRDQLEQLVQERSHDLVLARDQAQAASRAKSEFLSRMSHELRTPLNAVMGFSQLLELDKSLSPVAMRYAQQILLAGRHLLTLINEVLDLSQVESGHIALQLQPLALDQLTQEVQTLLQPLADQHGVELAAAALDGLWVLADQLRLRQVLVNLLSNAVKYNHAGGQVRVDARALADKRVRITVYDSGPGIAAQDLPRLFEPFQRLDASASAVEGTGIGLSICRRLVELMGGQIGVQSTPGEGSRFWVELPAGQPPTAGLGQAAALQSG